MKYIPPLEAVDPEAPYIDAAPEAGIEGSPVGAKVFEQPQREIVNLTTALGLVPTEDDVDQLAEAHAAGKFLNIAGLPDHIGGALDAAEVPILTGGQQKRISVAELFTGRAGLDQVARDQVALTNLRQILNTSVSTGALIQGRQFELPTDEWSSGSTSYQLVSATPNYYTTQPGVQAFSYTGADQTWTVPAGVTSLTVKMWAAGGSGINAAMQSTYGAGGGASGGYTTGTLAVTPGETLTFIVGQGGKQSSGVAYGGGGNATNATGGGGGGRSAIRRSSTELATAGGGGGGGGSGYNGGAGGGTTGGDAAGGTGLGGTQSAGGSTSGTGSAGTQFQGGASNGGGAGGGGYYGGGGGNGSGVVQAGGGGSGYAGGLTGASMSSGTVGNGASSVNPPNTGDADYASGVGVGGGGSVAGGSGRIVVRYTATGNMTLVSPAVSVSAAPTFMDAYFLWKDDSGSAVLGTDLTVEVSRDGGATWTTAALTNLTPSAGFDGTYAAIKARADVSGQPSGTSLKTRIKSLNNKVQRVAAPAIYAE